MVSSLDHRKAPAPDASRLYLFPIVALALILRLAVVSATAHSHTGEWFFAQASELPCLAQSMLSGRGFSSPFCGQTGPSAFLAPGYPLLVAAVFRLIGSYTLASAAAFMVLQAFFGAATVLVLMRLVNRLFGATAANAAGLVWTLSPPLLFLPIVFWETGLSALLLTLLVALALDCAARPTHSAWLVLGGCSLLTLAVNPTLLTAIVCCWIWATWPMHRKRSGYRAGPWLSAALCLLLFALWPIRNYHALHAFIPLRTNMGYELWQGNRPGSDGFFDKDLHPNLNQQEFARYRSLGELGYMHEKEVLAKSAIAADKLRFLALTAKRVACFWTGVAPASTGLMIAYASAGSALGFLGLSLLWKRNRRTALLFLGPLLLFPLPYYITHPDFRFRTVLDPLMAALAMYALFPSARATTSAPESTPDSLA